MTHVSPHFSSPTFTDKLDNGTVMVYIERATAPWTGTIVGVKGNQTLIFTASHCLDIPEPQQAIEAKLRVMFNGDQLVYPAHICENLKKSEILILRVHRSTNPTYKFNFAPKEEHELRRFQPVVTYAHPHGFFYRSANDTICSKEFKNAAIGYDKDMLFFDHRMDLAPGCSGASIFNESGNIVGLQSGMYTDTFEVMGAGPFETLIDKREAELKEESEVKTSKMQPGSVSVADEMRNLNDELGKLTVSFDQGRCMRRDIVPLKIASSNMKYAVHIKYIDRILRNEVLNGSLGLLNKLLEDKFIADNFDVGSSSAGSNSARSNSARSIAGRRRR